MGSHDEISEIGERLALALALALALVATACGSTGTTSVATEAEPATGGLVDDGDAAPDREEEDPDSDDAQDGEPSPTATVEPDGPATADASDLDELLLGERDLPEAVVVGPMPFADEPSYRIVDCESMAPVFGAHEGVGHRIRAVLGSATLRQSAVRLQTEADASSVLDAAEAVWERCPLVTTDTGDQWWVEPIEMPAVDGWRTVGLAIGFSPQLVWTIGWYQQGRTVVFADLDAANPWELRPRVDAAIAARLVGGVDPVLVTPEPAPTAPPSPTPSPTPEPDWRAHRAFVYLPDPGVFGDGWRIDLNQINTAAPPDPDDAIDGCDVTPPPTMDGLEVTYEPVDNSGDPTDGSDFVAVEVLVGVDDEAAAVATLAAFRAVADCPPESVAGLEVVPVVATGDADEVVAFEWNDLGLAGADTQQIGRFVLARYDDLFLGLAWSAAGGSAAPVPSIGEMVGHLDQWAAQGG